VTPLGTGSSAAGAWTFVAEVAVGVTGVAVVVSFRVTLFCRVPGRTQPERSPA
jgi:hypothetical protein